MQTTIKRTIAALGVIVVAALTLAPSVDAQRLRQILRSSAPGGGGEEPPPDPPDGVVGVSDITYLGIVHIPSPGAHDLNYGQGALAHRYVGGDLRIFTIGRPAQAGGGEKLFELSWPGVGGTMTVLQDYGSPFSLPVDVGQIQVYSLLWSDDINGTGEQGIIYTYGATYTSSNNPFIGVLVFDESDNITNYGPWGLSQTHSQSCKGYVFELPADVVTEIGGFRYACGSQNTANNGSAPFGTYAQTFNLPAFATAADSPCVCTTWTGTGYSISGGLVGPSLDPNSASSRMPREDDFDYTIWDHYWDSAYFGLPDPNPHWPPNNPTQDGSGCNDLGAECGASIAPKAGGNEGYPGEASKLDTIANTTYVYGAGKHAIIATGMMAKTLSGYTYLGNGRNHVWYGPPNNGGYGKDAFGQPGCCATALGDNTQTLANLMWIRDPAAYVDVFNAVTTKPENVVGEYRMSLLAHSGTAFPDLGPGVQPPWMASATWAAQDSLYIIYHPNAESGGCCGELKGDLRVFSIDVD